MMLVLSVILWVVERGNKEDGAELIIHDDKMEKRVE